MRWVKLTILAVLIVGVAIGGYYVYHTLMSAGSDQLVAQAEALYARGVKAYDSGDAVNAKRLFSDAILSADRAAKALEEDAKKLEADTDLSAEKKSEKKAVLTGLFARANFTRAKAQRDLGYAYYLGKNEGKKLAEVSDGIDEAPYRSFYRRELSDLRDDEGNPLRVLDNAISSLLVAARNAPAHLEIQLATLRLFNDMTPLDPDETVDWSKGAPRAGKDSADNIVKHLENKNPDARESRMLAAAHFVSARYYLGQAKASRTVDRSGVWRWDPRALTDLGQAAKHIDKVKKLEGRPRWQTLYVEAEVANSQWRFHAQENLESAKAKEAETHLRNLLYDGGASSAVERAIADIRDKSLGKLRGPDLASVLELHTMALTLAVKDAQREKTESKDRLTKVRKVLNAAIGVGDTLANEEGVGIRVALEIAEPIVEQAELAQPLLAHDDLAAWRESLASVRSLAEKSSLKPIRDALEGEGEKRAYWNLMVNEIIPRNENTQLPLRPGQRTRLQRQLAVLLSLSNVLAAEAGIEGKADAETQAKWKQAALDVLELAKKVSAARKDQLLRGVDQERVKTLMLEQHARETWRLHTLIVNLDPKLKPEERAEHLRVLRQSPIPGGRSFALLLEGSAAYRDGRLELAESRLSEGLQAGVFSEEAKVRAQIMLVAILMNLGRAEQAIPLLKEMEAVRGRSDLTVEMRKFVDEAIGTPDDLRLKQLQAHLSAAAGASQRLRLADAGKLELKNRREVEKEKADHEEEALRKLLNALPEQSPQRRIARQWIVLYYLATDERPAKANDEMKQVLERYPGEVDVLSLQLRMLQAQPKVHGEDMLKALGSLAVNPGTGLADLAMRWSALQLYESSRQEHLREGDKAIENFIHKNPKVDLAKLVKAEWLITTGRNDEALDYLERLESVPEAQKNRVQRLKAWLYYRQDEMEKRLGALGQAELGVGENPLLLFMGRTPDEIQKMLAESPDQFGPGLHAWNAGLNAMKAEQYEKAAAAFWEAAEYTQYRNAGRAGLWRALMRLAGDLDEKGEPARVVALVDAWWKERKTKPHLKPEPHLLFALAYAQFRLDHIGKPGDKLPLGNDLTQATMSAALDAWTTEFLTLEPQGVPEAILWRAAFWRAAGRSDLAFAAIDGPLNDPTKKSLLDNDILLLRHAQYALESFDERDVLRGLDKLNLLKKRRADALAVQLLEARYALKRDRNEDAIQLYEQILRDNQRANDAYEPLVHLLEKAGQKERARQWVAVWRYHLPNDLAGIQAEIRQLAADGKVAEALELAERTRADVLYRVQAVWNAREPLRAPSPEELQRRKDNWRQQMAEAVENDTFAVFNRVLMGLQGAGRYREAEEWYLKLDSAMLKKLQGQILLANLYMAWMRDEKNETTKRELVSKAVAIYQKIHQEDPWNQSKEIVANNLAWLLATGIEPPNPQGALDTLSESFTNRYDKSRRVTGDRMSAELLDTYGTIYLALKNKRWSSLRDLFEEALQRHDQDARIYLYLGHAFAGEGDRANAERMFRQAISKSERKQYNPVPAEKRKDVRTRAEAAIKALQ